MPSLNILGERIAYKGTFPDSKLQDAITELYTLVSCTVITLYKLRAKQYHHSRASQQTVKFWMLNTIRIYFISCGI